MGEALELINEAGTGGLDSGHRVASEGVTHEATATGLETDGWGSILAAVGRRPRSSIRLSSSYKREREADITGPAT